MPALTKNQPTTPGQSKRFWNWFEATLIGLLALVGVDVILSLLVGVGIGVLDQLSINTTGLVESIQNGSVILNFSFFAISRLIGLGLVLNFVHRRQISLRSFGFRRFKPFKSMGMIVVAMLGLFASTGVIFFLTQRLLPSLNLEQEQDIVFSQATSYMELILAFAALVIIAPIVEEVIFRGLILPAFSRHYGIWAAAIITSTLFGVVHWQVNVGITTFIMGLFLAWLYYKTRSLWPAIMFHSLKNLVAFVLIFNLP